MFTRAIVRIPGSNFADGLTTVDLGIPHFDEVLHQHARYCDALRECSLSLTILDHDLRYPDSTFVEDAAILTPHAAIFTRPGASSREGEIAAIRPVVERYYSRKFQIDPPGTVDGGDICEAEDHFFIGLSHRTNQEGARQLAAHLNALGYSASTIDIRAMTTILHLKSGISYIGDNTLVVMEEMAEQSPVQFGVRPLQHAPRLAGGELRRQLRPRQRPRPGRRRLPAAPRPADRARLQPTGPQHVGVSKNGRRPKLPLPALLIRAN